MIEALLKSMTSARALLVVVVHYGIAPCDGFEPLGRFELAARLDAARQQVREGQTAVVLLHVKNDTVPPVQVMKDADLVLDVRRIRPGRG